MNQRELATALSVRFDCPISLLQVGRYDRILFFGFRPKETSPFLVCRLGRSEEGISMIREQAKVREGIWRSLPEHLQEGIPWACVEDNVLIEPYLSGKPLGTQPWEIELALGWLRFFQEATARPCPGLLVTQAQSLIEKGKAILPLHAELGRLRLDSLERLTPCAVHGDFWSGNLMRNGRHLRVFDWEYLQPLGNPAFDPLLLLLTASAPMRLLLDFEHSPDWEAYAVTSILVLLSLVLRVGLKGEPSQSRYYPALLALLRSPDPVSTAFAKWFLVIAEGWLETLDRKTVVSK